MKVVYLDQNKWIDLARVYHGKAADPALRPVLDAALVASQNGSAAFPLSAVHYIETWKVREPQRRERLGDFMWKLSGGRTIAPGYPEILSREIEAALALRFPKVVPRPFTLVANGVAHAFGMPPVAFPIPETHRLTIPPAVAAQWESFCLRTFERAAITGIGPDGIAAPPFTDTTHNDRFAQHLKVFPTALAQLPVAQRVDTLYAMLFSDMAEPMNEVLAHYGIEISELTGLGKEGLTQFLHDVPTCCVDLHLHQQLLKNLTLRPRLTDLTDWGGLGPAVASCDVVVCEKHFASLINREGFRPTARVVADLKQLPDLL
jgi:hypothetical protein